MTFPSTVLVMMELQFWLAPNVSQSEPPSWQVGGSVDNLEETCATFTARALGLAKPLILTHQIDTCTEGWYE